MATMHWGCCMHTRQVDAGGAGNLAHTHTHRHTTNTMHTRTHASPNTQYYLTRAEADILRRRAPEILAAAGLLPPAANGVGANGADAGDGHRRRCCSSCGAGGAAAAAQTAQAAALSEAPPPAVIELGAGAMRKTRLLLDALAAGWGTAARGGDARCSSSCGGGGNGRGSGGGGAEAPLYAALDLCAPPLLEGLRELRAAYHGGGDAGGDAACGGGDAGGRLRLAGLVGTYEQGVEFLRRRPAPPALAPAASGSGGGGGGSESSSRSDGAAAAAEGIGGLGADAGGRRLFLWLGSSIGNLERGAAAAFLRRLRDAAMAPGGCLPAACCLRWRLS